LQFENSFLEVITFAKNLSKAAACHLQTQKTLVRKLCFLLSKLKLADKNLFESHSSSKTHTGDKKAISTSQPKPQEHTFARWREIAYGH